MITAIVSGVTALFGAIAWIWKRQAEKRDKINEGINESEKQAGADQGNSKEQDQNANKDIKDTWG